MRSFPYAVFATKVKKVLQFAILAVSFSAPVSVQACSQPFCLNHGVEVRPSFRVIVTHDDKPLASVKVTITSNEKEWFSGLTGLDGVVAINNLKPGDYWISSELYRVSAAYQCFHVATKSSRRAKRKFKFTWGELAPGTQRIAGKFIAMQFGKSGRLLEDLKNHKEFPLPNARMTLTEAITGTVYQATTANDGQFDFKNLPEGIYVLHVDAGSTDEFSYDGDDLLFDLAPSAKPTSLILTYREAQAVNCGPGIDLKLVQ